MSVQYDHFRSKAFSAFQQIARECPEFADAQMLVGSANATAHLLSESISKSIDVSWVEAIERALPALDTVVRTPSIIIEDVDELLPVELSRHINSRSLRHLSQHTNLIQAIDGDDVTPQKILNVYHDETYLTYENKFVNTLLSRLYAFVDKRYKILVGSSGTERNFKLDYSTEFVHHANEDAGKNTARVQLHIELTTPSDDSDQQELNIRYHDAIQRVERIVLALQSYQSSPFAEQLGRNYIRPPVIRTNAILKNKNLKECLTLWEYIEGFDKVGYTIRSEKEVEMPADTYISDLYSSVALQYVNFYNSVVQGEGNRLLSKARLEETAPEFQTDAALLEIENFQVYDTQYQKMIPVSNLLSSRRKLSQDEKRICDAIAIALKADEQITQELERRRLEAERLAQELRLAEERRLREEEEARIAEEKRILAEQLAAQQEAERIRLAEEQRLREEEEARIAQEKRILAEQRDREQAERIRQKLEAYAASLDAQRKPVADTYQAKNTPKQKRGGTKQAVPEYVFAGEDPRGCKVIIPYSRAEYSGMSRKKKKRVLAAARNAAQSTVKV